MSKTSGYRGRAAIFGLCVAGSMGLVAGSYADNTPVSAEKYEMQIFQDATGGVAIISGDYTGAVEAMHGSGSLDSVYASSTNM